MDKRKLTKVVIAVAVIGGASAYLLIQALSSSLVYYYSVDEFLEKRPGGAAAGNSGPDDGRLMRLAGMVEQGSVVRNAENLELTFKLAGRKSSVAVIYSGRTPENFAGGREVVLEGRMGADAVFVAENIMTKCESKYKVKLNTSVTGK
ncbi:MAG: cytochrome c maturation protein CcmE [Phycisphaerales bacterium]|nr:MAG: cytochrome c maturation protein CcmE [Phycisphaerales bacterium]